MALETDVVVVGAGGDGPALAWRLGQLGIDTLVLEAGPWHGHEDWPAPRDAPGGDASGDAGGDASGDPAALSGALLDEQFTAQEAEMGSPVDGVLRWGPADDDRPPWTRTVPGNGVVWQIAGVGGTTLHYLGNHPRAHPRSIDEQDHWPDAVGYGDLVPYYRHLEAVHDVGPAPTTTKEAVFYEGARREGYDRLTGKNVTETGYRPMPNAIADPPAALERRDGPAGPDSFRHPDVGGDTLAGHEHQGGPHPRGAPVRDRARNSSNVGLVPRALDTGHVTIRPNAFVTDVHTAPGPGPVEATGVSFRDTWSGTTRRVDADVVVLAAGCVETPRLWLDADLPDDGWVGRGMTTHFFDWVTGVFDADALETLVGERAIRPYVGQNGACRLDVPGVGAIAVNALTPGITAASVYSNSTAGYWFEHDPADEPWDSCGRVAGRRLKELMADYDRTLTLICHTDDRPRRENGVRLDPAVEDEHGPVPLVEWSPSEGDRERRDELARRGARLLRSAGADHVHRTRQGPVLLHMQSTMRVGRVLDPACEARNVDRLFVADHSALANGLGGANPTHTGQALALRTAERLAERYFDVTDSLAETKAPADD